LLDVYAFCSVETVLHKAGLSSRAAKVYMTCLSLGSVTMTEIAKAASFKRSTTYLVVDELLMRGFLSTFKKGKKTYYAPEHPQRILQVLRTKEKEFERVLPELEALYYEPKDKPRIKVYEGWEAMLQIYDEMYEAIGKKEEALFFSATGDLDENVPHAFEQFFERIREAPQHYRVRELNLGDERGKNLANMSKKLAGKNHKVRLLDPQKYHFLDTDSLIFGNKLIIFSFKKDIFTIVIESKQVADAYRAMYNAAWEAGEEV